MYRTRCPPCPRAGPRVLEDVVGDRLPRLVPTSTPPVTGALSPRPLGSTVFHDSDHTHGSRSTTPNDSRNHPRVLPPPLSLPVAEKDPFSSTYYPVSPCQTKLVKFTELVGEPAQLLRRPVPDLGATSSYRPVPVHRRGLLGGTITHLRLVASQSDSGSRSVTSGTDRTVDKPVWGRRRLKWVIASGGTR